MNAAAGCAQPVVAEENRASVIAVESFPIWIGDAHQDYAVGQTSGGIVPMLALIARGCVAVLSIGVVVALSAMPVRAADPDAFLAGTSRNCVECDLSGRDLRDRDFKRAKLDRAILRNADLAGASLFRATLVRADLAGATLKDANLNLV